MKNFDRDGSGSVNYHEFLLSVGYRDVSMDKKSFLEVFEYFDSNNNGKIDES